MACRYGTQIYYYPRFSKTISTDWYTRVTQAQIQVQKCKHLRFARGCGATEFDIYIFFPNLPLVPTAGRQTRGRSSGVS